MFTGHGARDLADWLAIEKPTFRISETILKKLRDIRDQAVGIWVPRTVIYCLSPHRPLCLKVREQSVYKSRGHLA